MYIKDEVFGNKSVDVFGAENETTHDPASDHTVAKLLAGLPYLNYIVNKKKFVKFDKDVLKLDCECLVGKEIRMLLIATDTFLMQMNECPRDFYTVVVKHVERQCAIWLHG